MAAFVSLLAASAVRIASLNLCSDEYALMLARPGELVSVTKLARDPDESPLAAMARTISVNRGRIEDVVPFGPTLIMTMGGGGRSSGSIAAALHLKVLQLPQPTTIDEVADNMIRVAVALGEPARALPWQQRLARLKQGKPPARDAVWIGGGGSSLAPGSLGEQWLRLAGLRQRPLPGGRATLEELLTRPPRILVVSDYRSGQMSRGRRWLDHPLLARLPSRRIATDGRRWTCAGPLMIDEIERLARAVR